MIGDIRNNRCLGLVACLCLVVASVTAAQAMTTSSHRLSIAPIVTSFTTAKFTVSTSVPTNLTVSTGTDRANLWPTMDRFKSKHVVTVRGLSPNTNYYAQISATTKTGKTVKMWRAFKTAAPGSAPATVTSPGKKLLLNGQPSFSEMAEVYACPDQQIMKSNSSLGVSVLDFTGTGCPGGQTMTPAERSQAMHSVLNGQAWWAERNQSQTADKQALQELPELLSWTSPVTDAPEGWKFMAFDCKSTSALYNSTRSTASTHTVVHRMDLATFGIKPNLISCLTPTAQKVEFWTAVAAGAQGTIYSTGDAGSISNFDVLTRTQMQARSDSKEMATLGPCVLTGKPVQVVTTTSGSVKFAAWRYGRTTCIVAVNTERSTSNASFSVTTDASRAQVMWERRNVKAVGGTISDKFGPLAVHLYKVTSTSAKKK